SRPTPGIVSSRAISIAKGARRRVTSALTAAISWSRKSICANRDIKEVQIGCIGLGAAGLSIATLLHDYTDRPVYGADISPAALRRHEERGNRPATLEEVLARCDVVVATTGARGLIRPEQVGAGQIILALSNPEPEITPQAALAAGGGSVCRGRDLGGQHPGLSRHLARGAGDARAALY